MAKVVLKTVQDSRNLLSILSGAYKPKFSLSCGAFDDVCTKSYKYMLDRLSSKTNKKYSMGNDTCIWSWYKNPYYINQMNYQNRGNNLVIITFEIDEEDVVFSDFDIWNEMILDGWGIDSVIDLSEEHNHDCIQAVSWNIPVDGILRVEPFIYEKNSKWSNSLSDNFTLVG